MQCANRISFDKSQLGFTLMELLVVIVVISIAFTMLITIAVPGGGQAEAIRKEALRLQQLLTAAHEQAVFRAEEYGVYFDDESYRFMLSEDQQYKVWKDIEKDKLFRKRELPEDMQLDLNIEQTEVVLFAQEQTSDEDTEENPRPQVFLLSSGETMPTFNARIRIPGFERSFEVIGSADGKYELQETE